MNSQYPSSSSSSSTSPPSRPENPSTASGVVQDMRAKAGEAISKVTDAAQQAGSQAKDTAASLASDAGQKAKGFLNVQVASGSDLAGHVARSVRSAADSLDPNAPQLASLARNAAERVEQFSRDIRGQTVEDLVRTASEFTRRQPVLVFGLASVAGFLAFRVLRSSSPDGQFRMLEGSSPEGDRRGDRSREPLGRPGGQFHGT
jgi:ABC-type transporter Mla subunit MlaD